MIPTYRGRRRCRNPRIRNRRSKRSPRCDPCPKISAKDRVDRHGLAATSSSQPRPQPSNACRKRNEHSSRLSLGTLAALSKNKHIRRDRRQALRLSQHGRASDQESPRSAVLMYVIAMSVTVCSRHLPTSMSVAAKLEESSLHQPPAIDSHPSMMSRSLEDLHRLRTSKR